MAMPLQHRGYKVHLLLHGYPTQVKKQYASIHVFECLEHLLEEIKLIDNFTDVYHVHNEPSYFVSTVKEISDKPVILDWHDSFMLREEKVWVDERNAALLADGYCFPSKSMRKAIMGWIGKKKPNCTLFSFLPKGLNRWDFFLRWEGGICYEGRIDLPKNVKQPKTDWDYFDYCEYSKLAEKLRKAGIPFYIYPGRSEVLDYYKDKANIAGCYEYYELIRRLSRHDWGLVGNIDSHKEWEGAMPNKMFEYIAAQVPVVAMNAAEAGEWLEKEGIGINIKSVKELKKRWDERFDCKRQLIKNRHKYFMENHIHKLENLYAKVIHL